ncbi:hypothetical protein [Hymenobacter ruricola]|uniref:Uncharacterized protein n=1 Tax=Hymenobacter ruricola TaxID=2791023 RepID=A0ABS0I7R6_9BACT|nr:hypothetical protein [Hymenobacter ruricola]MBF9222733.1 hypothetical protein [Hymenobacter ruricola]
MLFQSFPLPRLALLLAAGLSFSACKKDTDVQIKEVDKTYSWVEEKTFFGLNKVLLSTGKDASSLYLQTASAVWKAAPGVSGQPYLSVLGFAGTDVSVRFPLAADVYARPLTDTLVRVTPYANAADSDYSVDIRLHQLDPQAITYKALAGESSQGDYQFAAINQNRYLLLGYRRTAAGPTDPAIRLVLAPVTFDAFRVLQVQPRVLTLPGVVPTAGAYILRITAIDDYFLVALTGGSVFKIKQDGSVRLVSSQDNVTAFYKYQGQVYAHAGLSNLLVSADAGETWRTYTGVPSVLRSSGFKVLGDSLVGYVRPFNQLYSLRWNGGTGRVRELKNDGLGQTAITGIEQLRDTVYVTTTGGLFKRPLKTFFESKPQ